MSRFPITALVFLAGLSACSSDKGFKGGVNTKAVLKNADADKSTAVQAPGADAVPAIEAPEVPQIVKHNDSSVTEVASDDGALEQSAIVVTVSLANGVSAIKEGGKSVQAIASFSRQPADATIEWRLQEGSVGSIDKISGLYTSPSSISGDSSAVIIAVLTSENVSGKSSPLTIVKRAALTIKSVILNSTDGTTLNPAAIKAGNNLVQAVAVLDGADDYSDSEKAVVWSIKGSTTNSSVATIGEIDAQSGLYKSPISAEVDSSIKVVATLAAHANISASKDLAVLKNKDPFSKGCIAGNKELPIFAKVFVLTDIERKKLPDFSTITALPEPICLDQYNIQPQSFSIGFPGHPELKEYFALQTTTYIDIPADGAYVFNTLSDDGSIVMFDNDPTKVLNNDGQHGPTDVQSTIVLTKGKHELSLNWYQGPKEYIALVLSWKKPGESAFSIVPTSAFSFQK